MKNVLVMLLLLAAVTGCEVGCSVESRADATASVKVSRAEAALELGELAYHEAARARMLGLAGVGASLQDRQCFAPSELKLIGSWGKKCGGSCTLDLGDKTYNPFASPPIVAKSKHAEAKP